VGNLRTPAHKSEELEDVLLNELEQSTVFATWRCVLSSDPSESQGQILWLPISIHVPRNIHLQALKRNRPAEEHMKNQPIANSPAKQPDVFAARGIEIEANAKKEEKTHRAKGKKKAAQVVAASETANNNNGNAHNKDEPLCGPKLHSIIDRQLVSIRSDIKRLEEVVAKAVAAQEQTTQRMYVNCRDIDGQTTRTLNNHVFRSSSNFVPLIRLVLMHADEPTEI